MLKINKSLLSGSIILLVTINLFSLINLIFNLSMARALSLADYGILTVLTSFILIFAIFQDSIQTILSKYSANEKDSGKIKNIIKKSFNLALRYSIGLYLAFLAFAILLAYFFKINYTLIVLSGLMIFVAFFLPIIRGVMQGKKKFAPLGINMVAEASIKLVAALLFVFIGWKVYGAMLGIILGSFFAFLLSFVSLKDIFSSKEKQSTTKDIYSYSKPVFLTILAITLFFTLDVIMAKLFFPAEMVGAYALASTIAKIIFIGTQPISKAMFPFTAEIKNKNESQKAFLNSLMLIFLLVVIALALVFCIPSTIIWLYSGKVIIEAASILPYLALSAGILSFANLILYYRLSIGKTSYSWTLLLFVAIEALLLGFFHSSLFQFSVALITATTIFLWGAVYLLNAKN